MPPPHRRRVARLTPGTVNDALPTPQMPGDIASRSQQIRENRLRHFREPRQFICSATRRRDARFCQRRIMAPDNDLSGLRESRALPGAARLGRGLYFMPSACSTLGGRWAALRAGLVEVARTIQKQLRRGRDSNPRYGAGNNLIARTRTKCRVAAAVSQSGHCPKSPG
jgi:hypothetical protein